MARATWLRLRQRLAEPVADEPHVSDHRLRAGQAGGQQGGAFVVIHLAFGEEHHQRLSLAFADCVQLRV